MTLRNHFPVDVKLTVITNGHDAAVFVPCDLFAPDIGRNQLFQGFFSLFAARVGVIFGIITFLKIFRCVNPLKTNFGFADKKTVAVNDF